jgi:Putative prokaryotic signal transducing protein
MKGHDLVVLRTFENVIDAELAKSALEAADVASFIQADDAGGMRPHLGMNLIQLVVRSDDAEKALGILGGPN